MSGIFLTQFHYDAFEAAVVVIVLVTGIVGGALLEPLLHLLDIGVDVNQAEYTAEWHRRRELTGTFYTIEGYIYSGVVRNAKEEENEEQEPPAPSRRNGATQTKNSKGAVPKDAVAAEMPSEETWLLTPSPLTENGDRKRFRWTG